MAGTKSNVTEEKRARLAAMESHTGLVITDFTGDNLVNVLNAGGGDVPVAAVAAAMGQVVPILVDEGMPCWDPHPDFTLVWTRPESVLPEFRKVLRGAPAERASLEREVDEFCRLLLGAKDRTKVLLVALWAVPAFRQGHGVEGLAPGGVARALMTINIRLLQNLDGASGVHVLNAPKWLELAGDRAYNPRLWYLAKVPFGNEVFKAAAQDVRAALRGISGRTRKLIVLDLDDTLWGGIVGDAGWQNLALGGHDAKGEAHADFQAELKSFSERGVILGIVSKNEEATALEAIEKHPEMVLSLDDIAGWRINWEDKARNVAELTAELNLGLDAVVFIDDNPVERDRVREALPQVLVPDWPADPRFYVKALLELDCFATATVTEEDRRRSHMYVSQRQRSDLKTQIGSIDEWLESLEMQVNVESLSPSNLARATQLLNKTNQMNLSTRRVTESDFAAWAEEDGHKVWTIRVADKFGDSGLTGIISLEHRDGVVRVVDFLLSCRVMGRRIEEAMLDVAIRWAQNNDLSELRMDYRETAKNKPCRDFLLRSGLEASEGNRFTWACDLDYPVQSHIRLVEGGEDGALD